MKEAGDHFQRGGLRREGIALIGDVLVAA